MQIKNSNNKILILGDIFLDIFQTTNVIKISPERPVPVLQPKKSINLLGGAGNCNPALELMVRALVRGRVP